MPPGGHRHETAATPATCGGRTPSSTAQTYETFYDWNGDGCGDFRGMTERIEYLFDLGVTCLWLVPFFPSAPPVDGYDISDFLAVDPRLGTPGDFVAFLRTAMSDRVTESSSTSW